MSEITLWLCFFFQAEDGIRDKLVTGVQTCALPIPSRETTYAQRRSAFSRRGLMAYSTVRAFAQRRRRSVSGGSSPWTRSEATTPAPVQSSNTGAARSEERRVGKECRARGSA